MPYKYDQMAVNFHTGIDMASLERGLQQLKHIRYVLRKSQTEPIIRLMLEGKKKDLQLILKDLMQKK